jgi:hypothetical protein
MGLKEAIDKVNKAVEKSAKLTTKQRKKLKKSQFCGPGRSFPVNDCAHYTAALRLLNRSKYSESTKAKIRACVNRKGKAMGCTKKKEKSADIETLINSDVFKTTRELVEQSLENEGMELDFSDCAEGDCI